MFRSNALFSRVLLNFVALRGRKSGQTSNDPRTGEDIAEILSKAQVGGVVLNACESANTAAASGDSNLAELFLKNGIPFVLATAAVFMEAAAETFMRKFYEELLNSRKSIEEAVHNSRRELMHVKKRRAGFRQTVNLMDYAVPVLYLNKADQGWRLPVDTITEKPESEALQQEISPPEPLLGRSSNILELELLLSTTRSILLYGQGGIGKSTFLRSCAWWWRSTRWIRAIAFIDFSYTHKQMINWNTFVQKIREALDEALDEAYGVYEDEELLATLQRERCLVILDGLEAVEVENADEERRIQKFIASAIQGNSTILLSSRRESCVMADLVPNAVHYCLTGLSMQGAMQLAERHTKWTSKMTTIRENRDFLERIMILLERNPLAIKLIFPALDVEIETPEQLLHELLYGVVNIDWIEAANSDYARLVRWTLLTFTLSEEFGMFTPGMLLPFCSYFPSDLRNYFWFFWTVAFNEGTEIKRQADAVTLGDWAQTAWQERVYEAMRVFGYDKFGRLVDALVNECILDEMEITYADGSVSRGYHINPVFTILQRLEHSSSLRTATERNDDDAIEKLMSLAQLTNTAYVSFYVIEAKFTTNPDDSEARKKGQISRVIWDSEVQHQDHTYNNFLAAYGRSLSLNIMTEITHHGMPTTDMLLGGATDLFWNNRRTVEVLKPLIRQQVLRLAIVASVRLKRYEVAQMLDYAYLLVQAEDYTVLDIVQASLKLFEAWRAKGEERLTPVIELCWLQVRHAEGVIVQRRNGDEARKIFEGNLSIDPVTSSDHGLYMTFVRTQWNNLQSWLGCLFEEMPENPKRRRDLNEFLQTVQSGKMMDSILDLTQEQNPLHQPFRQRITEIPYQKAFGLDQLLEDHKETVACFGTLAKSLLSEPICNVWKGLSDKGPQEAFDMSEFFQGALSAWRTESAFQEVMQLIEYGLRYASEDGDGASTMATLTDMLVKETSFHNTSWRKLEHIHELMMFVAFKHQDWVIALRHLNERLSLQEGGATAAEKELLCCQFILCHAKLGDLESARQWCINAVLVIVTMERKRERLINLAAILANEAPGVLTYIYEHPLASFPD